MKLDQIEELIQVLQHKIDLHATVYAKWKNWEKRFIDAKDLEMATNMHRQAYLEQQWYEGVVSARDLLKKRLEQPE